MNSVFAGQVQIQLKCIKDLIWPSEDLYNLAERFHVRSIEEVIGFNKDIVHCCKDLYEDLLVVPLDSNDIIDVDFLHEWSTKDRDHHLDSKKKLGFIKEDFTGQFSLINLQSKIRFFAR